MIRIVGILAITITLISCSSKNEETPSKFSHDEIEDRKTLFGTFYAAFYELEANYGMWKSDRESRGVKEYISIHGMDGDTLLRDIHAHLKNFGNRMRLEFDFDPKSFVDSLENYFSELKTIKLPLREYTYLKTIEKHLKENSWTNTVENYEELELLYLMLYDMFYKSKSNYHSRKDSDYDNKSNVLYIQRQGDETDAISTIYMEAPAKIIVESFNKNGKLTGTKEYENVDSLVLPNQGSTALYKITYPNRLSFVDLVANGEIEDEVLIKVAQLDKINLKNWLNGLIRDRLNTLFPSFLREIPDTTGLTNFNLRESITMEESKRQLNAFYNGLYGREHYGYDIDIFSDTLDKRNNPYHLFDITYSEYGLNRVHNGKGELGIRSQYSLWNLMISSIDFNWTHCMHPPQNFNFGIYRKHNDTLTYYVGDVYFFGTSGGVNGTYHNNQLEALEDSLKTVQIIKVKKKDGALQSYYLSNGMSVFKYSTNQ